MENDKIKLSLDFNSIARQFAKQCVTVEKDKRKMTFGEIDKLSDGIVQQVANIVKLHQEHRDKVNKEFFASDLINLAMSYAYYNNINLNKLYEFSLSDD